MPEASLPVRRQYVISQVTVSVRSTDLLAAAVKKRVTVPPHPTGRVGDRELIQYVRSLIAASTAGAQALSTAEAQARRQVPKAEPAATERVKIVVRGKVVAPPRSASNEEVILGVALGDGSSTVHGRPITPPTPTQPEKLARRRDDLPPT